MTTGVARATKTPSSTGTNGELLVALPEAGLSMTQDAEWCVVRADGHWRQIRFHDYGDLYSVPGLYEKVIYEILPAEFGLPEQVDIVAVNIAVRGPTGRKRKVDVLSMLDEAEVFRLEDETDQTGE